MAMSKYYIDMERITICISGFLTEKQEHFSGWKEFVRENKQTTFHLLSYLLKSYQNNLHVF